MLVRNNIRIYNMKIKSRSCNFISVGKAFDDASLVILGLYVKWDYIRM